MSSDKQSLGKSKALFDRALKNIPGGVNSPVRAFKSVGGNPIYIEKGEGAFIHDIDGNRYLDFCGSWGPLILGHAHPLIIEIINKTAANGTSFGTVHENEVLLAEKVKKLCPHIAKIRFVSSGTEAVMSAVRLARAFTKRDKIIKFTGCYHGHTDYLLASAGSGLATLGIPASAGIPDDFAKHTIILPLNDMEAVEAAFEKHKDQIAAILIEPIPANNGLLLQPREFLQFLRDISKENQSLLVFDEVISGFRIGPGGATELYGIVPDLCTYGKVIGGGLPVGAFGGRENIMTLLAPHGPVYQAGTLSGNPLALACGLATLNYLDDGNKWNNLNKKSALFIDRLKKQLEKLPVNIVSVGSIFWINLQEKLVSKAEDILPENAEKYARLFHRALESGIYMAPSAYEAGFISTEHTDDDLNRAADNMASILSDIL